MIKRRIAKKTPGQYREICSPSAAEKREYRKIVPILNAISAELCGPHVHGFIGGKSPVTNARCHVGKKYTLRFDLSDFFDCVTPDHVKGLIPDEIISQCFYENRAYQGLPSSPAVANIAGSKIDSLILQDLPSGVVYTRYADDLTFSFDDYSLVAWLKEKIPAKVEECGFRINEKKTWLQDSRFGARRVTGILVDSDIRVPREIRRKMRAAIHQGNIFSASGLAEWGKLKLPNGRIKEEERRSTFAKAIKFEEWPAHLRHSNPDIQIGRVTVSQDPYYILGMNHFTNGWNDAFKIKDYEWKFRYYKEFHNLKIALVKGPKWVSFGGIARREILARALIVNGGDKFSAMNTFATYGHFGGNDLEAIAELKKYLSDEKIKLSLNVWGNLK